MLGAVALQNLGRFFRNHFQQGLGIGSRRESDRDVKNTAQSIGELSVARKPLAELDGIGEHLRRLPGSHRPFLINRFST